MCYCICGVRVCIWAHYFNYWCRFGWTMGVVKLDFVSRILDSARADCSSCAVKNSDNAYVYPSRYANTDNYLGARRLLQQESTSLDELASAENNDDGVNHNQMHEDSRFPESEELNEKGVHVKMDRTADINKIDVRSLPVCHTPARIEKRTHVKEVEAPKRVPV